MWLLKNSAYFRAALPARSSDWPPRLRWPLAPDAGRQALAAGHQTRSPLAGAAANSL